MGRKKVPDGKTLYAVRRGTHNLLNANQRVALNGPLVFLQILDDLIQPRDFFGEYDARLLARAE
jgi:hypothetical protein